jgi:hypothetical protein
MFLGAASFVYVTRLVRRWWWGVAAAVATTVASFVLLASLALALYLFAVGCYA